MQRRCNNVGSKSVKKNRNATLRYLKIRDVTFVRRVVLVTQHYTFLTRILH